MAVPGHERDSPGHPHYADYQLRGDRRYGADLYGFCFEFKRNFLAMMGGAALGAAYSGPLGCKGYVMASSNFMTPMTFAGGTTGNLVNGVIGCVIAVAASAALTYLFGFSKDEFAADKASTK